LSKSKPAGAAGGFFCAQLLQLNRVGENCVGIHRGLQRGRSQQEVLKSSKNSIVPFPIGQRLFTNLISA
jgi:hypothetical protein